MIYEQKCFSCKCDGCGESFCDNEREGFTLFSDDGQLTNAMEDYGWYLSHDETNKHYCPDCHTINDEDELVLKGKALETKS